MSQSVPEQRKEAEKLHVGDFPDKWGIPTLLEMLADDPRSGLIRKGEGLYMIDKSFTADDLDQP